MKIKKQESSFNTYTLEVSFGELVAIQRGLEFTDEVDPIVDEMREGISWYMNNLPGPGEDREEFKAKKDAEKELQEPQDPGQNDGEAPALPSEKGGQDFEPGSDGGEPVTAGPSMDADEILPEPPSA
jgi:hypothetical protein